MTNVTFRQKLRAAAEANRSWLCVGLDPDPALAPTDLDARAGVDWIVRFNRGIVEATADLVCCYKPNLGFFEPYGEAGWRALRETLRAIPAHIPVLLDAKRGDIGNTARGYAVALFETLGADAATVSPYLGRDSLEPFFSYPDKGVFVLCKTSNPSSSDLQDVLVEGPDGGTEPLYCRVARAAQAWDQHGTLGLVVGATHPRDIARVRSLAPGVPFLIPGVGAQAGDLVAAVAAGADAEGGLALVNASRSVLYASRGSEWQQAARAAAEALRGAIEAARGGTTGAGALREA